MVFANRANGTDACAIFPLINRDLAVGVLLLSSDQPGFFDEGRIEFFQMYADHAAAALEKAGSMSKHNHTPPNWNNAW